MRGITNTTGTACHLNSALIVLCHCLVPIREALEGLARLIEGEDEEVHDSCWIRCLGRFLEDLATTTATTASSAAEPVDSTDLYRQIHQRTTKVQAQDLGDAVQSLVRVLQTLRRDCCSAAAAAAADEKNHNHHYALFSQLIEAVLYSGSVRSVITGRCCDGGRGIRRRTKRLKTRTLSNPLQLPGSCDSLEGALHQVFRVETAVQGYQWGDSTTYEEEEEEQEKEGSSHRHDLDGQQHAASSVDDWIVTTKRTEACAFPPILLLHLQRFGLFSSSSSGGRTVLQPLNDHAIQIPERLRLGEFLTAGTSQPGEDEGSLEYELTGGILYVSDDEEEEDEEEGGHCVAAVLQGDKSCIVDDEDVTALPTPTLLKLLGGSKVADGDDVGLRRKGSCMRGVLLVYQCAERARRVTEPLLCKLLESSVPRDKC
jgi:hypothetical protein